MKGIFFTLAFTLISVIAFSQNKPCFIIEKSTNGYDLILKLENSSSVKSIKVDGKVVQDNNTKNVSLKIKNNDILDLNAIQQLSLDNATASFNIEIEDKNGNVVVYPSVVVNVHEEMFASN